MPKKWELKPKVEPEFYNLFTGFTSLQVQMAYNLGLKDEVEIEKFFNPKYERLHDPFLFLDMQKSVDRIVLAIERKEKILIYSDYDADAITATAVLFQTFKYLNYGVEHYTPDRFTEGYGLNLSAFEKFKLQGINVVITVDCGTNSVDIALYCKEVGIDLIITDHHEITGEAPSSFSLINPKNPKDKYPEHQITGVGVAFKLACALLSDERVLKFVEVPVKGWEKWLLDLVSIGTVADCHSLMGENRILVKYGLRVLSKTRWPGLKAMLALAGCDEVDSETLGFVLAPRINAAGRLEHASLALECLLADESNAWEMAEKLESVNSRRKALTERILSEAREMALLKQDHKVLVLSSVDWHKGLVGIVAGKISEEFCKPTIVLQEEEEYATGSMRTYGDFNTVEALKFSKDALSKFGGHKEASGLTVEVKKISFLREKLWQFVQDDSNKNFGDGADRLTLDAEITPNDLKISVWDELCSFEPFGSGNPKPVFLIQGLRVVSVKKIGNMKNHMQVKFETGDRFVDAVAFHKAFLADMMPVGSLVDVAAVLMLDKWKNNSRIKLRIVDLRSKLEI